MKATSLYRSAAVWMALCVVLASAAAQTGPAPTPAPAPTDTVSGEVTLSIEHFGVGNQARVGDWCGVRLAIRDSGSKTRNVMVRITGQDSDGDHPQYERVLTINPEVLQGAWVYLRLPFAFHPDQDFTFSAYEVNEDAAGKAGAAGRLLARSVMRPKSGAVLDSAMGMIGVLGTAHFGLSKYAQTLGTAEPYSPLRHEADALITGLTPSDLPDRWMGLEPFEIVVWGAGDPSELRGERARAVRDWVQRGGHLVVVLPNVGQLWTNPASNELHDILPVVTFQRHEGVDLEPYRPLLKASPHEKDPERVPAPMPRSAVVTNFRPMPDAAPGEAIRVLNGPDGECIVARRLIGTGAVTLVGLDLNNTSFAQGVAIDAEVFWHRVLGKRGTFLRTADRGQTPGGLSSRRPYSFTQDIAPEIAKTSHSAAGVLLGFVVFAAYWLVAGPLGFMVLKKRGWARHAWVGFVGVGVLFTGIAWGGASLIRPARVEATHLTLLDHVYGQPVQRTRTWMSLLIPWYGDATVRVGEAEEVEESRAAKRPTNLISSWDVPGTERSDWASFPDNRAYMVDGRSPDSITFPTRATVKQLQADWSGGPVWGMPHPVTDEGGVGRITLKPDGSLDGVLKHEIPGDLHDITVIVIRRQTDVKQLILSEKEGAFPTTYEFSFLGDAYSYIDAWKTNEELDLAKITTQQKRSPLLTYLRSLVPKESGDPWQNRNVAPDTTNRLSRLTGLAFFSQLAPPDESADRLGNWPAAATRPAAHGWDVCRWFSQPCVIIIAHLGDNEDLLGRDCPTPIFVNGTKAAMKGRTIIRWVYPLPDNPPTYLKKESTPPSTNPGGL